MNWNITAVRHNKREWILSINGINTVEEGAPLNKFLNKCFGFDKRKQVKK